MKAWILRFNIYLLGAALAGNLAGSAAEPTQRTAPSSPPPRGKTNTTATAPSKNNRYRGQYTSLRIHVEVTDDGTQRCLKVPVDRTMPMTLTIDRNPVLFEEHLARALVVDALGGFAIQLEFTERGTIMLDTATTTYRGQRLVVFANFGPDRWLAAPMVSRRIQNGILVFTPDATREEAERLVAGLNNTIARLKKRSRL
jgi:hypothetical protein